VNLSSTSPLSNDELIAFCEEVAALARAGVPLEKGLVALARDLPGRVGKFTGEVGHRLQQGESLSQVLDVPESRISPVFRAVVLAGVRGGRLPIALEGMATTLRTATGLRRMTRLALVYPVFVATLAFLFFLLVAWIWEGSVYPAYQRFQLADNMPLELIAQVGRGAKYWLAAPPLVLGVVFGGLWWRSRRLRWTDRGGEAPRWATSARLLRCGRLAAFADVLALLVTEQVPLSEAAVLAADASGDARLSQWARGFAERLQRGEPPAGIGDSRGALPPRLAWRIAAACRRGNLASAMRRAADDYRREAERLYSRLTVQIPLTFTVLIGGVATALYAFSVILPWTITLLQLVPKH
jgi:general secretion pathway protein F